MTYLVARRAASGVPIWNIFANGRDVGTLTDLPLEGAACITAHHGGRLLDFRAATTEAALAALRCAVDAIDHIAAQEDALRAQEDAHDYIEDEDGDLAARRHAERRADEWASRQDVEEPCW